MRCIISMLHVRISGEIEVYIFIYTCISRRIYLGRLWTIRPYLYIYMYSHIFRRGYVWRDYEMYIFIYIYYKTRIFGEISALRPDTSIYIYIYLYIYER
jgi:hypothetical protein